MEFLSERNKQMKNANSDSIREIEFSESTSNRNSASNKSTGNANYRSMNDKTFSETQSDSRFINAITPNNLALNDKSTNSINNKSANTISDNFDSLNRSVERIRKKYQSGGDISTDYDNYKRGQNSLGNDAFDMDDDNSGYTGRKGQNKLYDDVDDDDAEYKSQYGGKNENLNYLDDDDAKSRYADNARSQEKQLYSIFNQAREYNKRITQIQNQMKGGGDDDDTEKKNKPSKPMNKTFALMLELTKKLYDPKKYPDIPRKHSMKISKMIKDEALKRTGKTEVDESVKKTALELADKPDEFIERFRRERDQNSQPIQNKSNTRNKNSRNSDTNKRFTRDDSDTNRRFTRDETDWSNIDYTWKKNNGNDSQKSRNETDRIKSNKYYKNRAMY